MRELQRTDPVHLVRVSKVSHHNLKMNLPVSFDCVWRD